MSLESGSRRAIDNQWIRENETREYKIDYNEDEQFMQDIFTHGLTFSANEHKMYVKVFQNNHGGKCHEKNNLWAPGGNHARRYLGYSYGKR